MDTDKEVRADLEVVKNEIETIEQTETAKPVKKAAKKAAKPKTKKAPAAAASGPKRLSKGTKIIDPFTPHSRRIVTVVADSLNTAGYRRITIQDSYGAIVTRNLAGMKRIEIVE